LYQQACDASVAAGCDILGAMYSSGDGVPQDKTKALALYGKACNLKDEQGCKNHAALKLR
jgi:TPR repeat protein